MTEQEYNDYKENCVNDLSVIQDKLQSDNNLSFYESWFYDQNTGLLTLSSDDLQVNFKYFSVGTYSRNTKTWKWSWDNENTLDKVKSDILKVKEYGEKYKIEELTTGLFDADEEIGWEFTAIAANLLSGIGAYRAVDDHLLIFMVLIEKIENEEDDRIKDKFISCGKHGSRRRAFICKHLNNKTKTGFEEAFESSPEMTLDEDDDFQAWCSLCEAERQKEGEWNDKSVEFADIRLVCEDCFFEIKELNLGHK